MLFTFFFKPINHLSIYKNLAACLPLPSLTDFSSFWWIHFIPASSLCILDFPTPDIIHAFIQTWSILSSPFADTSFSLPEQSANNMEGSPCVLLWCPPSAFSSNLLIPHFLSFHLPSIPLFLSSNHPWSLSSSSLSTSDPPFPHHPMLWSLCSPSCDVPVWVACAGACMCGGPGAEMTQTRWNERQQSLGVSPQTHY